MLGIHLWHTTLGGSGMPPCCIVSQPGSAQRTQRSRRVYEFPHTLSSNNLSQNLLLGLKHLRLFVITCRHHTHLQSSTREFAETRFHDFHYYSSSSSSSLNPLSPYLKRTDRLNSPEVCTDIKQSFLSCHKSLW